MKPILACLAVAACALLVPAQAVADERRFAEAVAQYKAGRYSDAFGRFVELANAGDPDAARIALFMNQYGPFLYGSHWDAAPDELGHWTQLAALKRARSHPVFQPSWEPQRVATAAATPPAVRKAPRRASTAREPSR